MCFTVCCFLSSALYFPSHYVKFRNKLCIKVRNKLLLLRIKTHPRTLETLPILFLHLRMRIGSVYKCRTYVYHIWIYYICIYGTARRSNQSILKEISLEYSLEGLVLKLKLQYFGHLMWRVNSLEKTVKLGMIEGSRRRGLHRIRWLSCITDTRDKSLSKLWEMLKDREDWQSMGLPGIRHDWATEQQQQHT